MLVLWEYITLLMKNEIFALQELLCLKMFLAKETICSINKRLKFIIALCINPSIKQF